MRAPIRLIVDMATANDPDPILSYLILEGGKVIYLDSEGELKPMSHLAAGRGVELRFALEDCKDAAAAIKAIKKAAGANTKVTAWKSL